MTFERLHDLLVNNEIMIENHYLIIHSCKYSDTIMNIVEYFKIFYPKKQIKGWFILTNLKETQMFPDPDIYQILNLSNFTEEESIQYISKKGGIEKYAKEEDVKKYIKFLTIQLSNNPWRVQIISQFIKSKKLKSTNVVEEIKLILTILMKQSLRNLSFEDQSLFLIKMILDDFTQKFGPFHNFLLSLIVYSNDLKWDQETFESAIKSFDIYFKKETKEPNLLLQQLKHFGILQESLIGDKNVLFSIESTTLRGIKTILNNITIPTQNEKKIKFIEIAYRIRDLMKKNNFKFTTSFGLSKLYTLFEYKTNSLIFLKNIYSHGCLEPVVLKYSNENDCLIQMENENEICKILIEENLNLDLLERKIKRKMLNSNEQSISIHFGISKEDPDAESMRRNYLESQLNKKGYTIKKNVAGDGNCQFRATSDQLNLDDDKFHVMFRRRVVDWLRVNKNLKIGESDELHHFNYEYEEWDEFCDYMNENGVWGDHITLIALANYFKLRIKVISEVADPTIILPENKKFDRKIFLYHHVSGRHYLSILPINEEDEIKRDHEIKKKEIERKLKEEEEKIKRKEKEKEENELKKRKIEEGDENEPIMEEEGDENESTSNDENQPIMEEEEEEDISSEQDFI